ncbi:hypothetical protein HHI36_008231 [Cryptolaemus montrouzieri]|uniref:Peptidase M14 domain-containing protein n=1 Tax=Cryptolaemus montrouzieri TaxID=559131 RepID=A0ABD2MRY2_9CUCU
MNSTQACFSCTNSRKDIIKWSVSCETLATKSRSRIFSLEGRDLLLFEITAAKDYVEDVPNILLTGNIHGNEVPGREVLLHFIEHLIENYNKNDRIRWLLDNTRIHILPCMNPDGWAIAKPGDCSGVIGRYNAKKLDLNRNFPDFIPGNKRVEQVETSALRKLMQNISFVLAGDMHAGAIVTIYPFHRITKSKYGYEMQSSVTPDDNIFKYLANIYSRNNEIMFQQNTFCDNETFSGGITRGAAWYYFLGGMQDYSYMAHGTMALTFEISCCKYPPEENLISIWEQNRNSLVMFCSEANRGVNVQFKDSKTDAAVPDANITVLGIDKVFHSNKDGRFWKILLPGKYYLKVEASGYETAESTFEVQNESEEFPKLTRLEIKMNRT